MRSSVSSRRRRRAAALAALAALTLAVAACARNDATGGARAPAAQLRGSAPAAGQSRQARSDPNGTLVLSVRDAQGHARSGIPIEYRPPLGDVRRVLSPAGGVLQLTLAPGRYRVGAVVGCAPRAEVFRARGSGVFGVVRGRTVRATIVVDARRRYWPGSPVVWDVEPPWPHGDTVVYRFSIFDRCRDRLAPNTSFSDLLFAPANIAFAAQPVMRSDGEAYATLKIRCVAAGDAAIVVRDPENPDDSVDLLSLRPPFEPGTNWCG